MTKLKIKMKNVNTLSIAHSHRNNEPKTKKRLKTKLFRSQSCGYIFFSKTEEKTKSKTNRKI